jgi:hypothetical protein
MSTLFTPITLTGSISSIANGLTYGENDGTGMTSQYQTYDMTITVNPQSTGDGSTRRANQYNGIDVAVGMWISDAAGNSILRIKSISSKTTTTLSLVAEDANMLSYRLNGNNTMADGAAIILFAQNSEGEAIITDTSGFAAGGLDKVQSRFVVNEADDRVKFSHDVAPSVDKGDVVTVNSSGDLVKYGTAGGSDIKVGTVLDKIRGGKDVFVKPFNDIIREYKDPESLTANPGGIYYTDTNNAGEITTATGGKATYMHLNTAIASSQIAGTALPGATDVVEINGVTIFDGPNGDSVADIDAFRTLINNNSVSTNVTATSAATPVSIQGGDEIPNFEQQDYYSGSDSYIVTGLQGDPPAIGQITIGDGVNAPVTIDFDNPDDTLSLGASVYDVISPSAMLTKFQDAITSGSLDLTAELIDMAAYDGQTVKISTTGSATQVVLTNVAPAAFGNDVVGANSWTGIGMSATVGSSVLTLTRDAGGPINITGSPVSGGWINSGGAVSSNSGRVPYLLLIESEGGGGLAETGVSFKDEFNPSVTTSDEDTTGGTITYTPFSDGHVDIRVNGFGVDVGDGAKDEALYFSVDGGTTARAIADITAGDTLYWMGSIAGFELEVDDEITIRYQKSSND